MPGNLPEFQISFITGRKMLPSAFRKIFQRIGLVFGAMLIISLRLILLANALKDATPNELRIRVPGIPFCERGYNHFHGRRFPAID